MIIFDVPYQPCPLDGFTVHANDQPSGAFASRHAALAYALTAARRHVARGATVVVSLEGADGYWRAFDAHLQPLSNPA